MGRLSKMPESIQILIAAKVPKELHLVNQAMRKLVCEAEIPIQPMSLSPNLFMFKRPTSLVFRRAVNCNHPAMAALSGLTSLQELTLSNRGLVELSRVLNCRALSPLTQLRLLVRITLGLFSNLNLWCKVEVDCCFSGPHLDTVVE
jgi:hypothetical protein